MMETTQVEKRNLKKKTQKLEKIVNLNNLLCLEGKAVYLKA